MAGTLNPPADTVAAALPTRADTSSSNQFAGGIRKQKYIRSVVNLAIQAANALDHAHTEGIVHRDIKPANLLLDAAGRLWVTDFGLARIQADVGMTVTGDLVGTLRYMSPEQALAQRVVIDHRTDIYSLGVTLYELLTLRPTFNGADRQELLRQIAFDEPTPPRKLNPAIPQDLETIVLKAISKSPAERYSAARELADDLEHLLRSEPIHARRATAVQKIARWSRRHRGLVAAAAILLAVIAGLATAASVLLVMERDKTVAALANSDHQRTRAEENLRVARGAVDDMYTRVATVWLAKDTAISTVQHELLTRALEVYERLAHEPPTDAASRRNAAAAFERIGEIRHFLGLEREAVGALRRSIDLEPAPDGGPASNAVQAVLAARHRKLAHVQQALAAWKDSQLTYAAGLDHAQALFDRAPDIDGHRFELALFHLFGAKLAAQTGRLNDAETLLRRALDGLQPLLEPKPEIRLDWRAANFEARLLLSDVLRRLDRIQEAKKRALQTLEHIQAIRRGTFHDAREMVQLEAQAHEQLASVLVDLRQPESAAEHLRAALLLKQQNLRARMPPLVFHMRAVFDRNGSLDENDEPIPFCSYAETQLRLVQVLKSLGRTYEAEKLLGECMLTAYLFCSGENGHHLRYMLLYGSAWSTAADLVAAYRPQDVEPLRNAADAVWLAVAAYFADAAAQAELAGEVRDRLVWHVRSGAARLPPSARDQYKSLTTLPGLWDTGFVNQALGFSWGLIPDWDITVDYLEKSAKLRTAGQEFDWLHLAICHRHLAHADDAQKWHKKAKEAIGEKSSADLIELSAEVEKLLSQSSQTTEAADSIGD